MKKGISEYKLVKIAVESLSNSLRLHFDSILLYKNESFPTAFQISVLSLEELAKAKWVEHYIFTSITNEGCPDEALEQKWFQSLYNHPEKQRAFMGQEIFEYSPKFADFVKNRKLEEKKQNATYVGLTRIKGKVDASSRVSTPKRIKEKDATQIISLVNNAFLEIYELIQFQEVYFDLPGMDELLNEEIGTKLIKWPYKTGLKSRKWFNVWFPK